jgi:PD-(D/E)XK nuclease superfamily
MIDFYSNTSTSTFRRCTYKFHLQYGSKVRVREEKGLGLRTGSAGHLALKAFYSGACKYKEALEWAWEEFNPQSPEEVEEFGKLRDVLLFYWSRAVGDRWKILEVEKEVKVGRLMGIFDLIIEEPGGRRWIVDHKFQRSRSLSHLATDTQVSFYLLLARELQLGVQGLLYNIIPTGSSKPEPVIRKLCTRSEAFLLSFRKDLEVQIQLMDDFQNNPTPYRNFTRDCVWDCGLRDVCLKGMESDG